MKIRRVLLLATLTTGISLPGVMAQEKLGKVTFPTSCDPKVQAQFERGVAMLHSYWFIQARKTFEGVLQQDPNCAMAYWGIAVDLLGNTFGHVVGAKHEVDAIHELRRALQKSNQSYWADRSQDQILALSGWIAHAEGSRDESLKLMREAADREDASVKHVAMENRLYPMRELLAELLLETGQAAAALREYEAALKENPNRYRAIYGAARAAQAAGELGKAKDHFAKLVALSKNADTQRPELREAKTFLANK